VVHGDTEQMFGAAQFDQQAPQQRPCRQVERSSALGVQQAPGPHLAVADGAGEILDADMPGVAGLIDDLHRSSGDSGEPGAQSLVAADDRAHAGVQSDGVERAEQPPTAMYVVDYAG
jgi:hypothetical protein